MKTTVRKRIGMPQWPGRAPRPSRPPPTSAWRSGAASLLAVWLLVLPVAARATPPEWRELLSPESVASYVLGPVIVVEAGTAHPSLASASAALRDALAAADPRRLVMTGDALGNMHGLADEAIAANAARLPVDVVVTVRIFGAGDATTAVFAVLGKDGARDGFAVMGGQPLLRRAPELDIASPPAASPPAASPPAASPPAASPPAAEPPLGSPPLAPSPRLPEESPQELPPVDQAIQEYRRQSTHVSEFAVAMGTGEVLSYWGGPYKGLGEQREELDHEAFFNHIGRTDLEDSYRNRRVSKIVLWTLSGVTVVAGSVLLFTSDTSEGVTTRTVASVGLLGGAVLLSIPPVCYSTSPVDANELRQLSRDHNKRLRQRLGLPEDYEGEGPVPPRRAPPAPRLIVGATPLDGGLFAGGTLTY